MYPIFILYRSFACIRGAPVYKTHSLFRPLKMMYIHLSFVYSAHPLFKNIVQLILPPHE